jgi:hypothetical protein
LEENFATCPIRKTLAGCTEAISGFGKNSTSSAAEDAKPGVSILISSVMVMVRVFGTGLLAGLVDEVDFGAGEQSESTQRSAASDDLGMLAS